MSTNTQPDVSGAMQALELMQASGARLKQAMQAAHVAAQDAEGQAQATIAEARRVYAAQIADAKKQSDQQVQAADHDAREFASQSLPMLVKYAQQMGIDPATATWNGSSPRDLGEISEQFRSLESRGRAIGQLNVLDEAAQGEGTQTLMWAWISLAFVGTLILIVL